MMDNKFKILLTLLCLVGFLSTDTFAQNENNNRGAAYLFNVHYAYQQPGGDLEDRFGSNSELGISVDYLTKKNFIFGINGGFQFGIDVKEDVLAALRDNNSFILGNDSGIASVVLRRRGLQLGGHIGKLFPVSKKSRSGIRLTVGAGFFQHKIRVQDDLGTVPQVSGEYVKGYDRLTNGLATTQFLGYQLMSNNRRINLTVGVEALQGFTQNRRAYNYDLMRTDTENRLDMLFSFKAIWTVIPVFVNEDTERIYY